MGREHTRSEYEYAYVHGSRALFELLARNPDVFINWEAAQVIIVNVFCYVNFQQEKIIHV